MTQNIQSNFDIFRLKKAGASNRGILKLIKFDRQNGRKLGLRQLAQVADVRKLSDFMETYKSQDVGELRADFKKFKNFSILDEVYPERLKTIYNPPVLLFYKGDLDLLKLPKLAFVGSRNATEPGKRAVQKLIKELDNQFCIISGLAKGIDASSHVAAIKSGGSSIAVIGTGLDVFYPKENAALQNYMSEKQLVLTEYAPSEAPLKFHFPDRNRIIAGLVRGVVVVEAKLRSGSLITCERAIEEGRDVFAVPGNIAEGHSDGCNHLIQQGAKLVFTANDILEEYRVFL